VERWKCSECEISLAEAERKRRRLGLRRMIASAVTCSPKCARERERRLLHERYGAGSGYRYPISGEWHCLECACSVEKAHAKREARGLHPLTMKSRTCSPECGKLRMNRRAAAARMRTPEQERESAVRVAALKRARRKALLPLGHRVREVRQQRGMSQTILAERAGLTRSYISMLEGGWLKPPADALERLARALGAPIDKLLRRTK
jgi:DNA-binding XRE family transcriptional regulator